jgi:hypothetical protein
MLHRKMKENPDVDGILVIDEWSNHPKEFIVFSPDQVRSAIDPTGRSFPVIHS